MSKIYRDEDVKRRLEQTIFIGFGDKNENEDSKEKLAEKLLYFCIINEEKFKPTHKKSKSADVDSDDDEDKTTKKEQVCICLTIRKNMKMRMHSLRQTITPKDFYFHIKKSWGLDDIKSIESLSFGKHLKWTFMEPLKKAEFLYTTTKFCKKYSKKPPKFINFDEQVVKGQLKMNDSFLSRAEKDIMDSMAEETNDKTRLKLERHEMIESISEDDQEAEELSIIAVEEIDLEDILNQFNWEVDESASNLEQKLLKELEALESKNIHFIISSEEKADMVVQEIDNVLNELDTIDEWLTNYTSILDTMGADVHQVEVRNKNLQVASANQKALLSFMEGFIAKLKVPGYIYEALQSEPLDYTDGIAQCEEAINSLMKYVKTEMGDGLDHIYAVKEKVLDFRNHADRFAQRLLEHISAMVAKEVDDYITDESRSSRKGALRLYGHDVLNEKLFRFKNLLAWLKEYDIKIFEECKQSYLKHKSRLYAKECTDLFDQLRLIHLQKKIIIEDLPYLFSSLPIVTSSNPLKSVGTATKLATRKDLKKMRELIETKFSTITSPSNLHATDTLDERITIVEALRTALNMILPFMIKEQNIILGIFGDSLHNTLQLTEWLESLDTVQTDLTPQAQKSILASLDVVFGQVKAFLLIFAVNCIKLESSYSLGMLCETEQFMIQYEKGIEFISVLLNDLYMTIGSKFEKFTTDQAQIIDESKHHIRKKGGVLPILQIFPYFVSHLEDMIDENCVKSKALTTKGYEKILKSLFDVLEFVSVDAAQDKTAASDDKEHVNMHILNIENMHFLYSEMRGRKIPGFEAYMKQSKSAYENNLSAYCRVVTRRPLGKLLEFFDGMQDLLKSQAPEEIPYHLSYSKTALKDILKKFPEKEMKKALELLYKRVEKNFTQEDVESGQLLQVVWRGIQEDVAKHLTRFQELIELCYPESVLKLECSLDETLNIFSEIARAH